MSLRERRDGHRQALVTLAHTLDVTPRLEPRRVVIAAEARIPTSDGARPLLRGQSDGRLRWHGPDRRIGRGGRRAVDRRGAGHRAPAGASPPAWRPPEA